MTQEEALFLAHRHVAERNAETPLAYQYLYQVGEAAEYRSFWYFDYVRVHRQGRPLARRDVELGGLPGFVVAKRNASTHPLGWHTRNALHRFESAVTQLLEQPPTLHLLRQYFTLPLLELHAFKRELESPSLSLEQKLLRLHQQLLAEPDYDDLGFVELAPAIFGNS